MTTLDELLRVHDRLTDRPCRALGGARPAAALGRRRDWIFEPVDVARARLLAELTDEMGFDEESVETVVDLSTRCTRCAASSICSATRSPSSPPRHARRSPARVAPGGRWPGAGTRRAAPEGPHVVEHGGRSGVLARVPTPPTMRVAHRREAHEAQDVAFQVLQAVGAEVPAVDERGHAHGDDEARRPALEVLTRESRSADRRRRKPGRSACSRKPFSTAGMSPSHSGKITTRWLARSDGLLRRRDVRRRRAGLEFSLRAQQAESERRDVEASYFVAARVAPRRRRRRRPGHGTAPCGGIGVAVQDQDLARHHA